MGRKGEEEGGEGREGGGEKGGEGQEGGEGGRRREARRGGIRRTVEDAEGSTWQGMDGNPDY